MTTTVRNVLFVCAGNSARGLLAEALLTSMSGGRFRGHSAGIHPGGLVNPFAAELIRTLDYPQEALRSKRWTEYAAGGVPLHFVVSIVDSPLEPGLGWTAWPGAPILATWIVENPTIATGTTEEKRAVFKRVFVRLQAHIGRFLALPHDHLGREELEREINGLAELPEGNDGSREKDLRG